MQSMSKRAIFFVGLLTVAAGAIMIIMPAFANNDDYGIATSDEGHTPAQPPTIPSAYTATPVPPTATPLPPTATPVPPTATLINCPPGQQWDPITQSCKEPHHRRRHQGNINPQG